MGPSVVLARKSGASSPIRSSITPPSPTPGDATAQEGLNRQISASARRSAAGNMPKRRRVYTSLSRAAPDHDSGDQNNLADVALLQERLLRGDDVAQGKGGTDQWADLSAFDKPEELGEQARFGDGAAVEAQVLEVERAQVQCHDGSANGARGRVASAAPQDLQVLRKLRAAYAVNDHIDGFATKQCRQVGLTGQDALGAELVEYRLLASAGNGDDPRFAPPPELDSRRAHAAGGAGDHDGVGGRDGGSRQHVLGGQIGAGETRQLDVGELACHGAGVGGRYGGELGEGAIPVGAKVAGVGTICALAAQDGIHQDPLADPRSRDAGAH